MNPVSALAGLGLAREALVKEVHIAERESIKTTYSA